MVGPAGGIHLREDQTEVFISFFWRPSPGPVVQSVRSPQELVCVHGWVLSPRRHRLNINGVRRLYASKSFFGSLCGLAGQLQLGV